MTSKLLIEATDEIGRLHAAIVQTLDENKHLADGENCTLIKLKRTVSPNARLTDRVQPVVRPIADDGRCPVCWSYRYADAPGVWRRAICLDCEMVYVRLTGCEAFRHRSNRL